MTIAALAPLLYILPCAVMMLFCMRGMSQGRASYTMQFDHYEQVPSNVAAEVQAKYA